MHPSLPTWGTGKWEFGKRLPFKKHPQAINPEQGWIANWNNKPSVGWNNMDQCCADGRKWGGIQRVALLQDQMHKLLDGAGQAELSDLVDVARVAATQDARGVYLGPKLAKWAQPITKGDDKLAAALGVVKDWIATGAHRFNRDDNADAMDNSPALALFDRWWTELVSRIYDDELGKDGFEAMGVSVTDYSPGTSSGGGFFFDSSSYVRALFDPKAKKKLALDYCDNRETKGKESCKALVGDAFRAAYEELGKEQGADMAAWTIPPENIVFQELGAGGVDPIPWQNRGTHNHIAEILDDANLPPFVAPKPSPTGSGSPAPQPSGSGSSSPPGP
jgi:acyl-homoserine lactone acylase PvdQ